MHLDRHSAERRGKPVRRIDGLTVAGREVHDLAIPGRRTGRGPLRDWNTTLARPGSSRSITTAELARVA